MCAIVGRGHRKGDDPRPDCVHCAVKTRGGGRATVDVTPPPLLLAGFANVAVQATAHGAGWSGGELKPECAAC